MICSRRLFERDSGEDNVLLYSWYPIHKGEARETYVPPWES